MLKTNTRIVNRRIEEHVKEYYPNIEDLKADLNAVSSSGSAYRRGAALVDAGCFLCYNSQVADFLREVLEETEEEASEYDDASSWNLYKHLIAKACDRLAK